MHFPKQEKNRINALFWGLKKATRYTFPNIENKHIPVQFVGFDL